MMNIHSEYKIAEYRRAEMLRQAEENALLHGYPPSGRKVLAQVGRVMITIGAELVERFDVPPAPQLKTERI